MKKSQLLEEHEEKKVSGSSDDLITSDYYDIGPVKVKTVLQDHRCAQKREPEAGIQRTVCQYVCSYWTWAWGVTVTVGVYLLPTWIETVAS